MKQTDAEIVLVPHVFGNAGDVESDTVASAKIYQEFESRYPGRLHLIERECDQHEIKYLIGQCDFLLGSRMHACIAALSQGIPAIGLAYSKKFAGVLRTIGAEDLVIDLRAHDQVEIIARIDSAWRDREKTAAKLSAEMPAVKRTVSCLFVGTWSEKKGTEQMISAVRALS